MTTNRASAALSRSSRVAFALSCALLSRHAAAQEVVVRGGASAAATRIVTGALAGPHVIVRSDVGIVDLPRDSTIATTLIVLGADATVASQVRGDVIVVGGDLFLRPGARIDGDAVAIGGGYYDSTLGQVRGSRLSFRGETFVVTDSAGRVVLDYRRLDAEKEVPVFSLPGLFGLRLPTYDRVNGLSLSFGPAVTLAEGRFVIDPIATYRSDLGVVDPSLAIAANLASRLRGRVSARRATLTNDAWIWGDLRNSAAAFFAGRDARNYYRADRLDVVVEQLARGGRLSFEPVLGASTERAWSVGPDTGATSAPYSVLDRRDSRDGMTRPNPRVTPGRISSGYGGGRLVYSEQEVNAELTLRGEIPFEAVGDRRFVQTTVGGTIRFPTFGTQRFRLDTHLVLTAGDSAPRQRYAYLGGSGTLPTFDLLQFGGDQLFFADSRYIIPINAITLPIVGTPWLTLRHLIGSAGIESLPRLEQNLGVGIGILPVRFDFYIDPRTRKTRFSVSPEFSRQ